MPCLKQHLSKLLFCVCVCIYIYIYSGVSFYPQYQGGNGSSPVRGIPPAIRSPQNSHSHSTPSSSVSFYMCGFYVSEVMCTE